MRTNSISAVKYGNFTSINVNKRKNAQPHFQGNGLPILTNTLDKLEFKTIKHQKNVINAIKKGLDFLTNSSIKRDFGTYEIPINNPAIAPYIKKDYTYASFKKLYRQAKADGVFDYEVNKQNGFIKTSAFKPESYEEEKMAKLVWVTDTCRNMSLLEKDTPELCTTSLESISSFYKKQQPNFDNIIEHPERYGNNNGWGDGVFHEFDPSNFEPNYDFPRTRLESIGRYLKKAGQYINGGIEEGKPYGYRSSSEVSDNTIDSIGNCVKYLSSIYYPYAKSCGAWEERTFNSSLTSDTAIINEGFRKIMKLMYKETQNPEILKIRERIKNSKYGNIFNEESKLKDMLHDGEKRIIVNHLEEAQGERKLDSSLSFATHYINSKLVWDNPELTHSQNVINDVIEHTKLLSELEGNEASKGLIGDYGAKRYLHDEYKNLNYDIPELKGKINENHEAEWFMVSDISTGYGIQLKKITNMLKKEKRTPNMAEANMITQLLEKETEYINRAYARITGFNKLKANKKECPAFKLPEAYQAITDSKGNVKYVPGTNTPLTWAQSSNLLATKMFMQNLKTLEEMGLLAEKANLQKIS